MTERKTFFISDMAVIEVHAILHAKARIEDIVQYKNGTCS